MITQETEGSILLLFTGFNTSGLRPRKYHGSARGGWGLAHVLRGAILISCFLRYYLIIKLLLTLAIVSPTKTKGGTGTSLLF